MSRPVLNFPTVMGELAECGMALELLTRGETRKAFLTALPEKLYREVLAAIINRQAKMLPDVLRE